MNPIVHSADTASIPKIHLILCLGVDFDCAYIPHLCRYYGPVVDSWHVVLHTNDPGQNGERAIQDAELRLRAQLFEASNDPQLHIRVWSGGIRLDRQTGSAQ